MKPLLWYAPGCIACQWRKAVTCGTDWFDSYCEGSQFVFGFAAMPMASLAYALEDAFSVIALEALYE